MEQQLDAETYYKIADYFETELETIIADYDNLSIPVISTPRYFSQSTPEVRTIGQQVSLLQERSSEAIAILNTLAAIKEGDDKFELHPLLLKQMEDQIAPFVNFYYEFAEQRETDIKTEKTNKKQEKIPKK